MTRKQDVGLVQGVDDMQLGLIRIHDSLGPPADYAELLMLAAQALGDDHDAIFRGAYACLGQIQHTKDLIDELRKTGRVKKRD